MVVVGSPMAGAVQDFFEVGAPLFPLRPDYDEGDVLRLVALLSDRERAGQMKQAAADSGRANLGWARYVTALERVYADAVSGTAVAEATP